MLRNRLLVLVLLVLIPAFALVWRGNLVQQRMEIRAERQSILATARLAASGQEYFLKHSRHLLTNLTQFPFLMLATNRSFCEWHLANLQLLQPEYADFGMVENDGVLFCTALRTNYPLNLASDSAFQAVMKSDRFSIGNVEPDPISLEPILRVGCPIKDTNGVTVRVLYASLKLSLLTSALTDLPLPGGGSILVLDRAGKIVARHPDGGGAVGQSVTNQPYAREAMNWWDGVFSAEGLDGVRRSIAVSPIKFGGDTPLFVVLEAPQAVLLSGAKEMLLQNLWLMLVVGVCVLGAAWLYTNRTLLRPLEAMHKVALRLGEGDLSARTGIRKKHTEIHELAGVLDSMAEQLGERDKELQQAREMLELRVERRTAELAAANKELEAFSYSVSHDLQAPLRHIEAFAEILKDEGDVREKEHLVRLVETIQGSVRRMSKLINDLLSFSRMGNRAVTLVPCDFNQLVSEVIKERMLSVEGREIEWKVETLPTAVPCDVAMLRQVWANLLSNAIKYTRERKEARIEIGCHEGKGAYTFYVRDNGTGFDMKYSAKLFGVFQRLHSESAFEGTGIGLANVRRIVTRHHGRAWAEAEPDKGACFYFTIPRCRDGEDFEQETLEEGAVENNHGQGRTYT